MHKMIRCLFLGLGIFLSVCVMGQSEPGAKDLLNLQQSDIQPTGFTLQWETRAPMPTCLRYGKAGGADKLWRSEELTTSHVVTLEGLEPATFYQVRIVQETAKDKKEIPAGVFSTGSKSSGLIEVYFNQFTEPGVSSGSFPAGSSYLEVEAAIFGLINQAETSIDVAMYNANWNPFVNALEDAYDRGVVVRYIFEDMTNNFALSPLPDFEVMAGNPGDPLMHHKFLVIDADSAEDAYVICGAMNMTDNNLQDDYNNVVIIQDQALAKTFEMEFEEMWGGSGPAPSVAQSRFGSEKLDDTPHFFNIGGVDVECYFAPSDGVTAAIEEEINAAEEHLDFALLLLTSDPLSNALNKAHLRGVKLRGIVESDDQPSSDVSFLDLQGVNVQVDGSFNMLHHKYAIIDHKGIGADPTVVTGSFNWTYSAETINDESTLIFHDEEIANLFWQEFEARWGTVTELAEPGGMAMSMTFSPNPVVGEGCLWLGKVPVGESVWVEIFSITGQQLLAEKVTSAYSELEYRFSTSAWASGIYILRLRTGAFEHSLRFTVSH